MYNEMNKLEQISTKIAMFITSLQQSKEIIYYHLHQVAIDYGNESKLCYEYDLCTLLHRLFESIPLLCNFVDVISDYLEVRHLRYDCLKECERKIYIVDNNFNIIDHLYGNVLISMLQSEFFMGDFIMPKALIDFNKLLRTNTQFIQTRVSNVKTRLT